MTTHPKQLDEASPNPKSKLPNSFRGKRYITLKTFEKPRVALDRLASPRIRYGDASPRVATSHKIRRRVASRRHLT
jgi:hypothetical protein